MAKRRTQINAGDELELLRMIDSDTLCVFSAKVRKDGDSFVVEVPERELEIGSIEDGEVYRIAVHPSPGSGQARAEPAPRHTHDRSDSSVPTAEPSGAPVSEGETIEVEIEDIGDQGDGIARINGGFIVFVPDTTLHERVTVEITDVKDTVAFAEVIGRQDR